MFSNNVNHPNGFSGVINLAAFAQILLESGVNFLFINNTGMYVYCVLNTIQPPNIYYMY